MTNKIINNKWRVYQGVLDMTYSRNVLKLDGDGDYVKVPDHPDLSIAKDANGNIIGMTIHVEIRPDVLNFPRAGGTGPYVHFVSKKSPPDKREWVLRMYNKDTTVNRPNWISGYVYQPDKEYGVGAFFENPYLIAGTWIKVTLVIDSNYVRIYKNGTKIRCHAYSDILHDNIKPGCVDDQYRPLYPAHTNQPMIIGTDDLSSFFLGAYREIRKYDRPFTDSDVSNLAKGTFTNTKNLVFFHNYRSGNAKDLSGRGHDGILYGNAHFEIG